MNTRRKLLVAMAGAGSLAALALSGRIAAIGPDGLVAARRSSRALGANVEILAFHSSRDTVERAVEDALDELHRIEDVISLYRPGSEISRLNRYGMLERPDPDFVSLLHYARRLSARTGGAFDVTVQPLWELYAGAYAGGRLPRSEEIDVARARVGLGKLDIGARRVRLGLRMGVTRTASRKGSRPIGCSPCCAGTASRTRSSTPANWARSAPSKVARRGPPASRTRDTKTPLSRSRR